MSREALARAVYMADTLGYCFVATASTQGWPHMTAAGRLALTPEGHVMVLRWFCPTTTTNVRQNDRVALVVWDPAKDAGYQIVGLVEEIKDVGLVNTEVKGVPAEGLMERQLLLHVDRVADFRRGPHSDEVVK